VRGVDFLVCVMATKPARDPFDRAQLRVLLTVLAAFEIVLIFYLIDTLLKKLLRKEALLFFPSRACH